MTDRLVRGVLRFAARYRGDPAAVPDITAVLLDALREQPMDPTANVAEQLGIARRCLTDPPADPAAELDRLSELVVSLDGWMRMGGYMPDQWPSRRPAVGSRTGGTG